MIQERRIYNPADEAWKLMTLDDTGYLFIYCNFVCPWLYCPQLPRVLNLQNEIMRYRYATDWLIRLWDKRDVCCVVVTLEFARSTCAFRAFFQLILFFSASLLRAQSTFLIISTWVTDRWHVWGSVHFCCYSLRSICSRDCRILPVNSVDSVPAGLERSRCQIQTFLLYS